MQVDGRHYRTIWQERGEIRTIDQRRLPHDFVVVTLDSAGTAARAIREMWVRGAPLIGATAAWGLVLALRENPHDLGEAAARLAATRPTAVNLRWALDDMTAHLAPLPASARAEAAAARAQAICDADAAMCEAIGTHGLALIRAAAERTGGPVRVLTHCNAGWLATVDWGTATAPLYKAHQQGIPLHVWVDETRPRNQGAALTAWELGRAGIPHRLIVDNAGGHLMQRGEVDLCLVGTDRVTATGDVANKIGTYLKALAARDSGVPFHVALPSPTIDWTLTDGFAIPIEERGEEEVTWVHGCDPEGRPARVRIAPGTTPAANPAFDVTPARLVTGFITERGPCPATAEGLARLFPEFSKIPGRSL